MRATNLLLAGLTIVILGYGWAGRAWPRRARGRGAQCWSPRSIRLRALEARMAGYQVVPMPEAAARGDVFVTVTGTRQVLRASTSSG